MAPILGYWKIRGLAQSIRLLLEYCNEDYEDKLYSLGPGPEFSRSDWLNVKHTLGLPFPNLPYFIDADVKLSESKAILRYIGRKHNLIGNTAAEKANVDMLLDVCTTMNGAASRVFYNPDCEKMRGDLIKSTEEYFQTLQNFGQKNKWFTGENITIADFFLYEYFKRMVAFHPPLIDNYRWIKDFVANFEALSAIKKYIASDKFIKTPFNNTSATWTG